MSDRLAIAPVKHCTDCPFNHDDTCILDERGRAWFDDNPTPTKAPPWCALRRGVAVVELQEASP